MKAEIGCKRCDWRVTRWSRTGWFRSFYRHFMTMHSDEKGRVDG